MEKLYLSEINRSEIYIEYASALPIIKFISSIPHIDIKQIIGYEDELIYYSSEYNICYYKGIIYNKCDTTDDIIIKFGEFCANYYRIHKLPYKNFETEGQQEILDIQYDSHLNILFNPDSRLIIINNFMIEYNIDILYKYNYNKFPMLDVTLITPIFEIVSQYRDCSGSQVIENLTGNMYIFGRIKIIIENLKIANILHYPKDVLSEDSPCCCNTSIIKDTTHLPLNIMQLPTTFNIDSAISACEERMLKYTTHIEKLKSLKLEFIKLQTETTQLLS